MSLRVAQPSAMLHVSASFHSDDAECFHASPPPVSRSPHTFLPRCLLQDKLKSINTIHLFLWQATLYCGEFCSWQLLHAAHILACKSSTKERRQRKIQVVAEKIIHRQANSHMSGSRLRAQYLCVCGRGEEKTSGK